MAVYVYVCEFCELLFSFAIKIEKLSISNKNGLISFLSTWKYVPDGSHTFLFTVPPVKLIVTGTTPRFINAITGKFTTSHISLWKESAVTMKHDLLSDNPIYMATQHTFF